MTSQDIAVSEADEKRGRDRKSFWGKLRRAIGRAPFVEDAAAAWYAARDPETPTRVRAILYGALGYFVLPTDLIPDVILKLGFTDDATVLLIAVQAVAGHIHDRHRVKARAIFASDDPAAAARAEETADER
ncbi:MAG: YkvA family protein [Pseudomonadota bacterium]